MNDAQKAALTDAQRDVLEQAEKPYGSVDERYLRDWLLDVLTALADARLELQKAKDSRDGFACDLDAAEAEVARLTETLAAERADGNEIYGINKVLHRQQREEHPAADGGVGVDVERGSTEHPNHPGHELVRGQPTNSSPPR